MAVSESYRKEEEEPRREPAKDYYAGYYFSGNPYTSNEDLPGRKNDEELRDDVIRRLKRYYGSDLFEVDVHVVDSSVTLTGSVKTYKLKEEIGKQAWETKGVVKVLNELEVTDASTAGL
jgi:osmotically-inducible protein OsmY